MSEDETNRSLPYVCYERTLFHFLARNEGFNRFEWLLADRHLGFRYVPHVNEAIQYRANGLRDVQARLERTVRVGPVELPGLLRDRFRQGYQAHAAMLTPRPDGSEYVTSSLFEGMWNDDVFVTKTSEVADETLVPIPVSKLIERLPLDESGNVEIAFIRMIPGELPDVQAQSGSGLVRAVLGETFGYSLRGGNLVRNGEVVRVSTSGFRSLEIYVQEHQDDLSGLPDDKGLQLRLNKHIANKVVPALLSWDSIASDPDCAAVMSEPMAADVRARGQACLGDIADLGKWFSLMVGRPTDSFVARYTRSLSTLVAGYESWQACAHECFLAFIDEEES